MKKFRFTITLILLYSFAYGQFGTDKTIIVYDSNHNPLKNVFVEILNMDEKITDNEGKVVFNFEIMDIGLEYKLYIHSSGYTPFTESFWLKKIQKDNFMEIQLSPLSSLAKEYRTFLKGKIVDVNNKPLDSVLVNIDITGDEPKSFITQSNGKFYFELSSNFNENNTIKLSAIKKDYFSFDTSLTKSNVDLAHCHIVIKKEKSSKKISCIIKHRNRPLKGVQIQAKGAIKSIVSQNRSDMNPIPGAFTLETNEHENLKDTIYLTISKENYKTLSTYINLESSDSQQYIYYMRLNNKIEYLADNSFTIKLSIPYTSWKEWYVGLEYFYKINLTKSKFIDLGFNASFLTYTYTDVVESFLPNSDYEKEDIFNEYLLGITSRYWLTNPKNQFFSSYAGISSEFSIRSQQIRVFPYIGTRVFLSDEFAIGFECKYIYGNFQTKDYSFNLYGNAFEELRKEKYSRLLLNICGSWTF